jgi:hypothetical protein
VQLCRPPIRRSSAGRDEESDKGKASLVSGSLRGDCRCSIEYGFRTFGGVHDLKRLIPFATLSFGFVSTTLVGP